MPRGNQIRDIVESYRRRNLYKDNVFGRRANRRRRKIEREILDRHPAQDIINGMTNWQRKIYIRAGRPQDVKKVQAIANLPYSGA